MTDMMLTLLGAAVVLAGATGAVVLTVFVALRLFVAMFKLAAFAGAAFILSALFGLL